MPDATCGPPAPKPAGDSHRFWWTLTSGLSGIAAVVSFVAPVTGPAGFWLKAVALAATAAANTINAYYNFRGGAGVAVKMSTLVPTKLKRNGNGGNPPPAFQP